MYKTTKRFIAASLAATVWATSLLPSGGAFASSIPAEAFPTIQDPYAILEQFPGTQQQSVTPSIPNPVARSLPQLPHGSGGGMPPPSPPAGAPVGAMPASQDALQHPVNVATGELELQSNELQLPGVGFGFELTRAYDAEKEELGAFGRGWDFNWNSHLQMYADYALGEYRFDGTVQSYTFEKDDPDGYILEFDNDDKVNYELDKGHYEPMNGETLTRIGRHEYELLTLTGEKLTYYGYFAPWRTSQDAKAGKMIRREDRYGNAIELRV